MKKLIAVICIFAFVFSLAACGKDVDTLNNNKENAVTTEKTKNNKKNVSRNIKVTVGGKELSLPMNFKEFCDKYEVFYVDKLQYKSEKLIDSIKMDLHTLPGMLGDMDELTVTLHSVSDEKTAFSVDLLYFGNVEDIDPSSFETYTDFLNIMTVVSIKPASIGPERSSNINLPSPSDFVDISDLIKNNFSEYDDGRGFTFPSFEITLDEIIEQLGKPDVVLKKWWNPDLDKDFEVYTGELNYENMQDCSDYTLLYRVNECEIEFKVFYDSKKGAYVIYFMNPGLERGDIEVRVSLPVDIQSKYKYKKFSYFNSGR